MSGKPTYEELEERVRELEKASDEYKNDKKQLVDSKDRLKRIFDQSPIGAATVGLDGRFRGANSEFCRFTGYTEKELLSLSFKDITHPGHLDSDLIQIQRLVSAEIDHYQTEKRYIRKDGDVVWGRVSVRLIRDEEGKPLYHLPLIEDITAKKEAEQALHDSELRYKAIVEDQTELICRFHIDGIITFVNDAYCRYFGKKKEELIGKTFISLIPKEDHKKVAKHFSSIHQGHPVATHEHRVIASNGEIRWQEWTNRMLLNEMGKPVEFQSVGRDITERKLMEEALKESSEKVKLFAYSISHDLKNPTIGLYGIAKRLYNNFGHTLGDKGSGYCERILKISEQIAELVKEINVFISTTESPLKIEKLQMKDILHSVKEEFSSQLTLRRINWLEPDYIPEIRADRLSIIRALRNLVDNAIKYGGDDLTEINLNYKSSRESHILSIKDNGIGLKEVECSKDIFHPFIRKNRSKEIEGAGLGLAIVKEILEKHGGRVWLETGGDRGLTFYLSVPKYPSDQGNF